MQTIYKNPLNFNFILDVPPVKQGIRQFWTLTNIRIPYQKEIEKVMYVFSFFGKVCLFLMIRWIAKQKRFLFFLVQKANSMSESSFMLGDFYKIYEGCPDEEREE